MTRARSPTTTFGPTVTASMRANAPNVATVLTTIATVALRFLLQQTESAPRALFHQLPPRLLLCVLLTAPVFRVVRRLLRRRGMLERTAEVRLLG